MTREEVEELEAKIAKAPNDVAGRSRLIRYYGTPQQVQQAQGMEARRRHVLWLIENAPEADVLAEPAASLSPGKGPLSDPAGAEEAVRLWRAVLAKRDLGSRALMRAASFLQSADRALAHQAVEQGIRNYPAEKYFMHQKGTLDAQSAAGVKVMSMYGTAEFDLASLKTEQAMQGREQLLASKDPQHLTGAVMALPHLYMLARQQYGEHAKELFALTEKLASRLRAVDSNSHTAAMALSRLYTSAAVHEAVPKEKLALLERAYANATTPQQKFYVQGDLAEAFLATGDHERAAKEATEWLQTAASMPNDWNHGNAVHRGNLVLGRIALAKGDVEEAKQRLLAAGRTKGSPQLNSFGPRWELAQELLNRGERNVVLDYLALCKTFWSGRGGLLENWASAIRSGAVPRLGPAASPMHGMEHAAAALTGKPAPGFELKDLQGKVHSLDEYRGKVVLLDFWTTWCGPCRAEMPIFEKLHRELATGDVAVVAVDVDEPKETVAQFIEEGKYTLPVLLTEGTDIAKKYGIQAFPTLITLDKQGQVAEVIIGSRSEEQLRRAVETARAGAPAPGPPVVSAVSEAQAPEDYFRDATGLLHQGKLAEAEARLTRAMETRKEWVQALVARGQTRYRLKKYDDAIADFDEVIRLRPEMASAYDQRGLAYSYSGRHEKAIPDYTKAIELAPEQAQPYNNRGWAHLELKRYPEAMADLNQALELNPAYRLALENRLRLHMETKEYAEAVADGEAVLRVEPHATWAKERIAEARRLMGGGEASLAAPEAIAPEDGAVFSHYPRDTVLRWAPVPRAVAYEVDVDYSYEGKWHSEAGGPQALHRTTEPEYRFPFVGAQPGRWRVRALAPDGQTGEFSPWRHFRYTR
jgi:tetratricopeptide (TPR) repeat protein